MKISAIETNKTCAIVDKIVKDYNIDTCVKNDKVMNDIKSAIEEAYMNGIVVGSLDNELLEEAINFFKNME